VVDLRSPQACEKYGEVLHTFRKKEAENYTKRKALWAAGEVIGRKKQHGTPLSLNASDHVCLGGVWPMRILRCQYNYLKWLRLYADALSSKLFLGRRSSD
jgi:hypothetical protein